MNNEKNKCIIIIFRPNNMGFAPERKIFDGPNVSYKVNDISAPGCLKFYDGPAGWTKIYPLDVIQEVDMTM
jgi:hypothetical protein